MQLHCPECGTTADIDEERIEEVIENHNDSRHGGESIAGVGPDAVPLKQYTSDDVDPLYAHQLPEDDIGPMGEHPDGVRAVCRDCELVALFDSEYEAHNAVEEHDELCHNGEYTAGLCKWDLNDLPSAEDLIDAGGLGFFMEVAGDIDLAPKQR